MLEERNAEDKNSSCLENWWKLLELFDWKDFGEKIEEEVENDGIEGAKECYWFE